MRNHFLSYQKCCYDVLNIREWNNHELPEKSMDENQLARNNYRIVLHRLVRNNYRIITSVNRQAVDIPLRTTMSSKLSCRSN